MRLRGSPRTCEDFSLYTIKYLPTGKRKKPDLRVVPPVSGEAAIRFALNTSDKSPRGLPTVRSYVCKNLIEIGECAAFIPELHALR
jgi:hypothetical protein